MRISRKTLHEIAQALVLLSLFWTLFSAFALWSLFDAWQSSQNLWQNVIFSYCIVSFHLSCILAAIYCWRKGQEDDASGDNNARSG